MRSLFGARKARRSGPELEPSLRYYWHAPVAAFQFEAMRGVRRTIHCKDRRRRGWIMRL